MSEDDRLLGQANVIISVLIIICMNNFSLIFGAREETKLYFAQLC